MQSTVIDSKVFGYLFSTDEMRNVFSDRAWVQKFLDMEAALAKAQGELGVIPKDKADIINEYAKAELLDIPSIGEFIKSSITIVPVLKAFKKVLPDNAGEYVHWGATSQDVYDTALVLMQRDAYEIILRDLKICLRSILKLAKKYRAPPMAGRTHVVHAIPITFGYKAAVWADELGRDSQAEFMSVLALCAGTLGRINHEIFTLQRTEILELEEPFFMGKVGSSTMPQKRNPAVLENVWSLLRNVRGLAPTVVESMISENERDWGCFISEWEAIPKACLLMAAALEKSKNILENLIVYKVAMEAYEKEVPMKEILMQTKEVTDAFQEEEIDYMLDPRRSSPSGSSSGFARTPKRSRRSRGICSRSSPRRSSDLFFNRCRSERSHLSA